MDTNDHEKLAELLHSCEKNGLAIPYAKEFDTVEEITIKNESLLIVSDLHLGPGIGEHKVYAGTENFFADEAFARLLASKQKLHGKKHLVINGDFVDFLRITTIPLSGTDYSNWSQALKHIDPKSLYTPASLEQSIVKEKRDGYGLKTHDFKSVWKLLVCASGHPHVFAALAQWVAEGNELVIVKGNHDLEWYWPAVRNYLRYLLLSRASEKNSDSPVALIERKNFLKRIRFVENAVLVNGTLHIEHGHRHDNFSRIVPPQERELSSLPGELNISFGSFFNRYVLNRLELKYPYYDNVRPRTSLLPMLIKKDFPLAVRVYLQFLPRFLKSVTRRYYGALFGQAILFFLALAIPLAIVISQLWPWINAEVLPALTSPAKISNVWDYLINTILGGIKSIAWLALAYPFGRLMARLQLVEESSLLKYAVKMFDLAPQAKVVVMGHTHDPEQYEVKTGQFFYNTGAWIPIIEATSASVREDKTYTFVDFYCDNNGDYTLPTLKRWNDDAERVEDLTLIADPEVHTELRPKRVFERLRWLGAKP